MTTAFFFQSPILFDAIGVAGFGLYVLNYSLLTLQRIKSESIIYFVVNGTAACMVLIGLMHSFNLAAALVQIFFICASLVAIVLRLRIRHKARQTHGAFNALKELRETL